MPTSRFLRAYSRQRNAGADTDFEDAAAGRSTDLFGGAIAARRPARTPRRTRDRRSAPSAHRRAHARLCRCPPPCAKLSLRSAGAPRALAVAALAVGRRDRALDETAAQHTRLALARVVEHAGLAGRNAVLAVDQFDFVAASTVPQASRPAAGASNVPSRTPRGDRRRAPHRARLADPVDVAQHDAAHAQRLARADDDAAQARRRAAPHKAASPSPRRGRAADRR